MKATIQLSKNTWRRQAEKSDQIAVEAAFHHVDDEPYFNMKRNDWQKKTLNEFAEYPVPESVNVNKKSKWKSFGVADQWLSVNGLAVNKEV
jgi:hypothetical protein